MAAASLNQALDSNNTNAVTAALSVPTESVFTLYVTSGAGAHVNHEVALQVSANGTRWITLRSIIGEGCITEKHAAAQIRAKLTKPEGTVSGIIIDLVAK